MSPPGAAVIKVDPQGFSKAASIFAANHAVITRPADQLIGALSLLGGSAGSDRPGRIWSSTYDPAAADAIDALGDLALGYSQMHDLLQFTAANHSNANSQSGPRPNPSNLMFPPGSLTVWDPKIPPPMFGGSSTPPGGWSLVKDYVGGEVWPNGNADNLRIAANAWRTLATSVESARQSLGPARTLIQAQQSPETAKALEQTELIASTAGSLAGCFRKLAESCDNYAAHIDNTKRAIITMLIELVAFIAVDQALGWGVAAFTGGGSAAAAQGAMALLLTAYGTRIANTIRALYGLAQVAKMPAAAAQAMARSVEILGPLLGARPMLAGANGAKMPEAWTKFYALRRPQLTEKTKAAVEAATAKWKPAGAAREEWYVVEAEKDIKVPINKSYDDKPWVTQLPKDDTGKYYVDRTNRSRYPVNPRWEFGHVKASENRRLLAEGQARNMTQPEFNAWVNSRPDKFFIEDLPGNRSHRRELK